MAGRLFGDVILVRDFLKTFTFTDYHSQVSLNGLKKRASSQGLTITKITDIGNVILYTV